MKPLRRIRGLAATQPSPALNPGRRRAARNDLKRQLGSGFGVDQAHRAQTRIAGHGVAGDQAATVVTYHRYLVELEQVDHSLHRGDVLLDRHGSVGIETARTGGREVDEVARHVVDQVGEEQPERRSAGRPAVDEQHVGAGPHVTVGGFSRSDVEEPVGLASEQVSGIGGGQGGNRVLHIEWRGWLARSVGGTRHAVVRPRDNQPLWVTNTPRQRFSKEQLRPPSRTGPVNSRSVDWPSASGSVIASSCTTSRPRMS